MTTKFDKEVEEECLKHFRRCEKVKYLLWNILSAILEEPSTSITDALRRQSLDAIEVAQRGGKG